MIKVKRRFGILLMACLLASPVFAEKTENASLNYGVHLGADIYSVMSDTEREKLFVRCRHLICTGTPKA